MGSSAVASVRANLRVNAERNSNIIIDRRGISCKKILARISRVRSPTVREGAVGSGVNLCWWVRNIFLLYLRGRSEEHTSELQSLTNLVCRLLLEKKKKIE